MKPIWLSIRSLEQFDHLEYWYGDGSTYSTGEHDLAKNSKNHYKYCGVAIRTIDKIFVRNARTRQQYQYRPHDFASWSIE